MTKSRFIQSKSCREPNDLVYDDIHEMLTKQSTNERRTSTDQFIGSNIKKMNTDIISSNLIENKDQFAHLYDAICKKTQKNSVDYNVNLEESSPQEIYDILDPATTKILTSDHLDSSIKNGSKGNVDEFESLYDHVHKKTAKKVLEKIISETSTNIQTSFSNKNENEYQYADEAIHPNVTSREITYEIKRPGSTIAQQNKEYYSKISFFIFVGLCVTAICVLLTLILCKNRFLINKKKIIK
jgi:hypothetical protein